jgi:acyl carrier protein
MEPTDRIREFVRKNLAVFDDEVSFGDGDNIFALGLVDSFFAIQLIAFTEEEFGLKVADSDLDIANFNSVSRIAEFVSFKKGTADVKQS